MKLTDLPIRTTDPHGAGHFGAPRGSRKHNGIDLCCQPNTIIPSPVDGEVTKIGYPYADHLEYRYVQVTSGDYDYLVMYIDPTVTVGQKIRAGETIGVSQALGVLYPGITEHVHFEIKHGKDYVDPTPTTMVK